MSPDFLPRERLDCPDPANCPVAAKKLTHAAISGTLPTTVLQADSEWFRIFNAVDDYATPNPGKGNSRFSPFDALSTGLRVPSMYLAETLEGALLETSFHDVPITAPREVSIATLHGMGHAHVRLPTDLVIADLRDGALKSLGVSRSALASSSREHYPCTRRVAKSIHASLPDAAGIVWHSRQAEINRRPEVKVLVIFGDRAPVDRGDWELVPNHSSFGALLDGSGKLLVDRLADSLGVTLVDEIG
ncbi:RES family NAD+ phosphorylase [Brevibacterium sp. VCM10]|uniref:RES family NAD+ phosphorylase n=1 Tax=Brevibacterium sp. VCM10 TaxID=1381751 RepID=UPI00046EC459|nr:RES family NAD+ phosphorylase [Brevibacterium sp. VCM10]